MEEHKSIQDESGELIISKENKNLEEKYKSLLEEIAEKSKIMDEHIEKKTNGNTELEQTMSAQIKAQEATIKEQTELYKEKLIEKKKEEQQLKQILQDYTSKFNEFSKGISTSKKTLQTYEKELKNLNIKINHL